MGAMGVAMAEMGRTKRLLGYFIVACSHPEELGFQLATSPGVATTLLEVYDRAHFPTVSAGASASAASDVSPMPIYEGNQLRPSQPARS